MSKKLLLSACILLFAASLSSQAPDISGLRLLIRDIQKKEIVLLTGDTRHPIISDNNNTVSDIRLDCTDANRIYFIKRGSCGDSVVRITDRSKHESIYDTTSRITDFALCVDDLYLICAGKGGIYSLIRHDLKTKGSEVLYRTMIKKEYLSDVTVNKGQLLFLSHSFGKHQLVAIDISTNKKARSIHHYANIFGKPCVPRIVVEPVDVKGDRFISNERYARSLAVYEGIDAFRALSIIYEPMAGSPIIIDKSTILVPMERNRLINQLKSIPFGFRDKDVEYALVDLDTGRVIKVVLRTNTRKMRVLDASL
ncbi:MAG: hypothetical protein JXA20_17300 [Spirochaetes bacterium]|nr:hypothetical protein [Spirochaetota bacterium]